MCDLDVGTPYLHTQCVHECVMPADRERGVEGTPRVRTDRETSAATAAADLSFLPFSDGGLVPGEATEPHTPAPGRKGPGDSDQPQRSGGLSRSQEGEAGTSQGSTETLERTPGCPPPPEWGRSAEGLSEMTSLEGVRGDRGYAPTPPPVPLGQTELSFLPEESPQDGSSGGQVGKEN